ncbi:MAG: phosphoribosylaminoimidazolesuccinocarboxamide synthase [Archaeoglobus sp.]|jgi:phosphoribosylaminoimidazole-succinocarboxamide synthase|nr:MAG: phosphoribosylaminoimidazolesuccinocarboxamide synthase [Archaeoglobus sp.]
MGSVKDLHVIENPSELPGKGRFIFSDRYSVFDYGEMPDLIEGKGKALCLIAAYFFELAEKRGMRTHYIGLIDNNRVLRLDEIDEPTNIMEIRLFRVVKPLRIGSNYDYTPIKKAKNNYLIPLEVIYRNVLPEGSSVFKRLRNGTLKLEDLGLNHYPSPGEELDEPIIEVSTKLESEDRYISWKEAVEISGISESEMDEIKRLTLKMDKLITEETEKTGIKNLDGKFEFAFDENRKIIFVDTVGTPDECRFAMDGVQVSKEILRKYYRQTEWYRLIDSLKGTDESWREKAKPPKLPEKIVKVVSDMYKSCCNEITGKRFFDVDSLKDVVRRMLEIAEDYNISLK